MQRPEAFRSLAELLRPPLDVYEVDERPADASDIPPTVDGPSEFHDLMRDVRCFRAHLRDTLERSVERLLEYIAEEVLAREIALAPCDIQRIVERALELIVPEPPITVRVSEADISRVQHGQFPVEVDASMKPGDVTLILAHGTIATTLTHRLNDAIAEALAVMHDC